MTRLHGSEESIEKAIADYDNDVARPASQQPGFQGIVLLVDRQKGEAISVSYWQDEGAMRASEAFSTRLRKDVSEKTGMAVTEVATGEILDTQRAVGPAKSGTFIRLNTVEGQGDRLDAAIALYKTKVIPVLKECAGFRASILTVNREQSRMVVSTVWNSAQEREASDARLLDLRRESGEAAGARSVRVELFESVFVNMLVEAPAKT